VARRLRVQYAGRLYHVLNRDDRELDFRDDTNLQGFLATMGEVYVKTGGAGKRISDRKRDSIKMP